MSWVGQLPPPPIGVPVCNGSVYNKIMVTKKNLVVIVKKKNKDDGSLLTNWGGGIS